MSLFTAADYVVCGMMLSISALIGVYFACTGGRQRSQAEYLLADRSMGALPVSFSLLASFMSAITLLGVSAENYTYGTQFVLINVSYVIATPIAAHCYLPVFYRLSEYSVYQVSSTTAHCYLLVFYRLSEYSVYQYLEYRFGTLTRMLCSLAFSLQMILYMGVVLYAPAIALSTVTGISLWLSVLLVGLVCTFYSTLGGMKAVLVTDVFQTLLMFAAIFAVIAVGCVTMGGPAEIWRVAEEGGRIEFFNISPDPTERHTVWSLGLGGVFIYLSLYAVNQAQVQRLLSVGSLRRAQLALWIQCPILTCLSLSTSFAGLVVYAHYHGCDPFATGKVKLPDQLLPRFVMDTMRDIPGLPGLFVAGIFSGSLSTVSSAVNSLAAVTVHDYVRLFPCWSQQPAEWELPLTKLLSLGYGLLCLAVSYVVSKVGASVLTASLTIFGAVGGPLLGVFTLGMFSTGANQRGAVAGLLVGLAINLWIGFAPKPPAATLPVTTDLCRNDTHVAGVVLPAYDDVIDGSSDVINATAALVEGASPLTDDSGSEYFYLYRLSYMWISMVGFLVTCLVGLLVSLIGPRRSPPTPPGLLSPPVAWLRGRMEPQDSSPSRMKLNGSNVGTEMDQFEAKTWL
ncbi:putative sodium-dependent multivitamin transporter [Amphibalanus amphitrite]|uniref:Putative sodium-dependent multivitamin transporter n=1 Tax=Amphibalanus amphitrite TaxID=1232801 RepID=A0A6A4VDE3_AMPAM|nr:putative sodium-dependent multivitamin transporter [Amphibalanus amphitrite]KAF0289565.1 putative sodium-dependent multivitamin transporter [Amphibalanus amphitrite]